MAHKLFWHGYATDAETLRVYHALVKQDGGGDQGIFDGNVALALSHLSTHPPPACLLLSFDSEQDSSHALSMLSGQCRRADIKLILLGLPNQALSYAFLKEHGVDDYLPYPFATAAVRTMLQRLLQQDERKEHKFSSKLIVCIGARSGVGTTTIAVNIATLLAETQPTVLIDLDLYEGETSLHFNETVPYSGLEALITHPDRIDHALVTATQQPLQAQLWGMGDQRPYDHQVTWNAEGLDRLCAYLYGQVPYVVVDLPRTSLAGSLTILRHAHAIVLVSDYSMQSFHQLTKLLPILASDVPSESWSLWFNEARPEEGMDGDEIVQRMRVAHTMSLPHVPDKFVEAFTEHVPFVQFYPSHPWGAMLRQGVQTITKAPLPDASVSAKMLAHLQSFLKG
jgi:pilus assembly protein CpaE